MKKISLPLILLVSMSLLIVASAYASSGGITGKSDTGCGGCHGSSPSDGTTVTIDGLPTGPYEPGKNYSLTITVTSTDVPGEYGGFDLSVTAGTLVVTNATATQIVNGELTHTSAGTHQRSWSFNWTAPTTDGEVTFYAAGLAANGDSDNGGDAWATYSTAVIPEFPGLTILLVLAAVTIMVLFFTRKKFLNLHQ